MTIQSDKKGWEVKILGRVFGTAMGWDQFGDSIVLYYDFKPNAQAQAAGLKSSDLAFDTKSGLLMQGFETRDAAENRDVVALIRSMENA